MILCIRRQKYKNKRDLGRERVRFRVLKGDKSALRKGKHKKVFSIKEEFFSVHVFDQAAKTEQDKNETLS